MSSPAAEVRISGRVLCEVRPAASDPPLKDFVASNFPLQRQMRVYAVDASVSATRGGIVTVTNPFEPLHLKPYGTRPGALSGSRFEVCFPLEPDDWSAQVQTLSAMDINSAAVLAGSGYAPSLSDPRFVAQMVYAVASQIETTFRRSLGRDIVLGLNSTPGAKGEEKWTRADRFELHPWADKEAQAWFDREKARIAFGTYKAQKDSVGYAPGSLVYTALSHDVIVHEMTHALLDATKPYFLTPTNRDVLAFHEAFADLITIFQRFSYGELVAAEVINARGDLDRMDILNSLARTFATTVGVGSTLRDLSGELMYDTAGEEPHQLGSVLVQAVYRAFRTVATSRIARLIDIASSGSGILPKGALSPALAEEVARRVCKTASMFQAMLIRALDYSPPFDITFADFLRAVITADVRLVPVDEDNVRLAWMEAFRHHHIFPDGRHFTDESLCWEEPPKKDGKPLEIPELSYEQTAFFGNPGQLMALEQAAVQACAVAEAMTANEDWRAFLRISPERPLEIIGIRSFARPGPNGLTEFGTVVEIIGRRTDDRDRSGFLAGSGACLVFDSLGALSSCAQLGNEESDVLQRSDRAERYCVSRQGQKSWVRTANGEWMLHENLFRRLCMR